MKHSNWKGDVKIFGCFPSNLGQIGHITIATTNTSITHS